MRQSSTANNEHVWRSAFLRVNLYAVGNGGVSFIVSIGQNTVRITLSHEVITKYI